jgi:membrane protein implicated in regulation of membrane protease activity
MELLLFLALIIGLISLAGVLALIRDIFSQRKRQSRLPPTPNLDKLKPQIEMVGREAVVTSPVGQGFRGTVKLEGELWLARLVAQDGKGYPAELESGARVRVVEQHDLLLLVEPLPQATPPGWQEAAEPDWRKP